MEFPPSHRLWMYDRLFPKRAGLKQSFVDGVWEFILFAITQEQFRVEGGIRCPCVKCECGKIRNPSEVIDHLKKVGFRPNYWIWTSNGEKGFDVVPLVGENCRGAASNSADIGCGEQINLMQNMVCDGLGVNVSEEEQYDNMEEGGDDAIPDVEGGDDEDEIILCDRRVVIRVEDGGFLPSRPAANAIRQTIHELYHYPWTSWLDLNEAERTHFFNGFRKRVAWRKSQEAAVEDLFHRNAALRLSDILRRVRMGRDRPLWMGDQVYNHLRDHIWNDPKFKAKCERNKKNRASEKGGSLHTGGSISMLQHSERLAKKMGRKPHVDEVHRHTHIRKDTDEFVEDRARITQEKFQRLFSQSDIPVDPVELAKLKRLLWEEAAGGPYKSRGVYGTGSIIDNMVDSGASMSAGLSPEASRIIQQMSQQFEERFARQQQLIEYVFNHFGIQIPPPDWQPPEQDQPAQQGQPAQQDESEDVDDGDCGDHGDHVYEKGY